MVGMAELPDGQEFFKLNEVCKLANVQPYMLRFWGTEFEQLEAQKTGTGQRLYSRDQVELILEIRRLLFDDGLTIAGARKRIAALEDGEIEVPPKKPTAKAGKPAKKFSKTATTRAEPASEEPDPRLVAREVDKQVKKRVQPLLATLTDVRQEVEKLVAELEAGQA
jgi:DNA-binding transcriptional MerR regulator